MNDVNIARELLRSELNQQNNRRDAARGRIRLDHGIVEESSKAIAHLEAALAAIENKPNETR